MSVHLGSDDCSSSMLNMERYLRRMLQKYTVGGIGAGTWRRRPCLKSFQHKRCYPCTCNFFIRQMRLHQLKFTYTIGSQGTPSLKYSACSLLNTTSTKPLASLSFVKLIHNCSKMSCPGNNVTPHGHTSHPTRHKSHPTRLMLHLLKRVVFEYLEAVDIKNTKEIAAFLWRDQQLVELGKEPNKAPVVKGFGQRVAAIVALSLLQRLHRRLIDDDYGTVAQPFFQRSSVDAKEPATRIKSILVAHGAAIALGPKNVAEVHDSDNQLK